MGLQDMKIYYLNAIAMIVSFSGIEQWLKVILLIASIVYTIMRIIELKKKKNETNE